MPRPASVWPLHGGPGQPDPTASLTPLALAPTGPMQLLVEDWLADRPAAVLKMVIQVRRCHTLRVLAPAWLLWR